jgi:NADP-dependent 3-hydroxy acid dehydrogenase YdfG
MEQTGRQISIVTGATGGIGRRIALGLTKAGHHVNLVCWDTATGDALADWIAQEVSLSPSCASPT